VRTRLRLGISRVQLAKRIEQLQKQAEQEDDIPSSPTDAATEAYSGRGSKGASALARKLKGDIFRAVVLAKAKEMKAHRDAEEALIAANAAKHS